jgi:hypothetical protein
MPTTWLPSIYRTHDAQTAQPSPDAAAQLMGAVDECNVQLHERPYEANYWLKRAECYLKLNYPELAAGDAYKAILLLDRHPRSEIEASSDEARTKACQVLGQALYDCHCHQELVGFWEGVSERHPSESTANKLATWRELLQRKTEAAAPLGGSSHAQRDRIRDGGVITVVYPWIQERHRQRSKALIDHINEELRASQTPCCHLGRSSLAQKDDMLGMFAAKDIHAGVRILVDRTATGICTNPEKGACDNCYGSVTKTYVNAVCCSVVYCSPECHDLAMSTYHRILCQQDFAWLLGPARGLTHNASSLRSLLMLRFLAASVQANLHPLDHPLIARLQPLADANHVDVFTFTESITTPVTILQQLGVDIFTDPRFDFMTLYTIWTRIANNKAGSSDARRGFIDLIAPHLPFFNHSCEPNVEWRRCDGSTTIWFFAKRQIEEGEELYSSYVDVEGYSREERQEALWPWFEGECLCKKCKREAM